MKRKNYLFAVLLSTLFFLSCSEEQNETAYQEDLPKSMKSTADLPPMVIKQFDRPFSSAMENFHKKVLRLSGTEFIDEYNSMNLEQRAEFAAEFLKEESVALLKEVGTEVDPQADAQELAKEALTHYSKFINQNQ